MRCASAKPKFGNLFLYEKNSFRVVAMHNAPRAYAKRWRREPVAVVGRQSFAADSAVARTKAVILLTLRRSRPISNAIHGSCR